MDCAASLLNTHELIEHKAGKFLSNFGKLFAKAMVARLYKPQSPGFCLHFRELLPMSLLCQCLPVRLQGIKSKEQKRQV